VLLKTLKSQQSTTESERSINYNITIILIVLHFDEISHDKKKSILKESFFSLLCKIYSTKIFNDNQTKTYILIII